MKNEFVSYEIALSLKELGFNEPCFFAFDNCSTPMRCTDLRTNEQKFNGVNYNSSSYTSQPTFSQAFKFFRDKFKLFSYVELHLNFPIRYYFIIYEIGNDDFVCHTEDETIFYDKYEEAELACLLKLIEVVKKK